MPLFFLMEYEVRSAAEMVRENVMSLVSYFRPERLIYYIEKGRIVGQFHSEFPFEIL